MNYLSTVLKHQRERIQMDYRHEEERLSEQNRRLVYDNQKETAFETINHYNEGKQLVLIVAQPGTGKTGVVLETLKQLTTHIDDRCCVETKNIHVISGMNDTDWRKQFQEKMLPSFRENIHHRSILNKHVDEIASITNGILITDECHIASNKNMTISKILRCSGLTDCNTVETRNVRLLDISATPESVAWDIEAWGDKAAIVRLMPGPSYKGFQVMLDEGRIREAPLFNDYDVVKDWFKFFEDRYAQTTKKYFPVRVTNMDAKMYLRRACLEFNWDLKEHNSNDRILDIDNMMGEIPQKHTIILIKEFWRASKRLVRNNVGGSYEQKPKKRNDSTAAQSTIGRFCDNYEYVGDELNPDWRPVHYGDKTAIEEYVNWFNNGCDFNLSNYTCTRITSKDGNVISKESKLHYTNFRNLEPVEVPNNVNIPPPIKYDRFDTFEQLSISYKAHKERLNSLKPSSSSSGQISENSETSDPEIINGNNQAKKKVTKGPQRPKLNEEGFYEAIIHKVKKVWSCAELDSGNFVGSANNPTRVYPCYADITDNTTLQWRLYVNKK